MCSLLKATPLLIMAWKMCNVAEMKDWSLHISPMSRLQSCRFVRWWQAAEVWTSWAFDELFRRRSGDSSHRIATGLPNVVVQ